MWLATNASRLLAVIALALSTALAGAATDVPVERKEARYAAPGGSRLIVRVPVGWKESARRVGPDKHPAFDFKPRSGPKFEVLLSPLPSRYAKSPDPQPQLRKDVLAAAETFRDRTTETVLYVNELLGPEGQGYYFAITDSAPKPGEYKYMTQGMMLLGGLQLSFVILTNDGQQAIVDTALDMVRNAGVVRAAAKPHRQKQ